MLFNRFEEEEWGLVEMENYVNKIKEKKEIDGIIH